MKSRPKQNARRLSDAAPCLIQGALIVREGPYPLYSRILPVSVQNAGESQSRATEFAFAVVPASVKGRYVGLRATHGDTADGGKGRIDVRDSATVLRFAGGRVEDRNCRRQERVVSPDVV